VETTTTGAAENASVIDLMLSHDWPTGVVQYGDKRRLLKTKPFFKDEVRGGKCYIYYREREREFIVY
jgi:hypothetical protein